jgi:hypothetical protein
MVSIVHGTVISKAVKPATAVYIAAEVMLTRAEMPARAGTQVTRKIGAN